MKARRHDFSGACEPVDGITRGGAYNTFSLGIFEWVACKDPSFLKRGKVKVRVSGPVSKADAVRATAAEIVSALDAGTYNGPKRVKVKA